MSTNLNLNKINYQDNLRSKPHRDNYTDIQTQFNALRSEVYASISSTASEVTSARDGYNALVDNINARSIYGNGVSTGGVIYATGHNYVVVSTGAGITPDGQGVSWNKSQSGTIGAVTKPRYIVACINSDNSLSLELGATGDDPFYPSITRSQRPLATFLQSTSGTVAIAQSDIIDAKRQGCLSNNKWYFSIQDAINSVPSSTGGIINIGAGKYIEDAVLTGKSNIELNFENNADIYRINATAVCIKSVNTAGSISENIKITGGSLYDNSKNGTDALLDFDYNDNFIIDGMTFNGGGTSTNTYKNFDINSCSEFVVKNTKTFTSNGTITDLNYRFRNCTDFQYDNTTRRMTNNLDQFEEIQIYTHL